MFFVFGLNLFLKFLPMPQLEGGVGPVLGSFVCFALRLACWRHASGQRSAVSDWPVRTVGDCA